MSAKQLIYSVLLMALGIVLLVDGHGHAGSTYIVGAILIHALADKKE